MENIKKIFTLKRIIFIIIFILVVIFACQNMSSVSVSFIFFSIKLPILGLILSMYIIGAITGWAVKRNGVKKMINSVQDETKKDIRQLQKQIRK
ncbi:LapA family protein [Lactococcus lactis]|nr:LapA family protein [Lactococcus lactis]